jgi:hypothetical protein
LRIEDREEFIALMLRDIPPRPPNAEAIRARNAGRVEADVELVTR